MAYKIVVDDKIPYIKGRLESFADIVYSKPELIDRDLVKDADAIVVRTRTKCGRELLEGSSVKLVVTATIGVDHIDVGWCEKNGICVVNAPGCNAPAVAQYVWASLLRNSFDPRGKRIGIIGCGNVGRIVADWGRRLGAEIAVSDPILEERGYDLPFMPLERILSTSDAVTLHVPLTRSPELFPTFHLISDKELNLMNPGAWLINASRGAVVDNESLLQCLESGKINAVIDTWEGEPEIDSRIANLAAIATPHIAGYSRQGKERATRMALEALDAFFGFNADKSGLEGRYSLPESVSAEKIIESYDPSFDTEMLRKDTARFEKLRSDYNYRDEPVFNY